MRIAIRVDSSAQVGSGHLMRCLTLAKKIVQSGDEIVFISRDLLGNLSELVNKEGFKLAILSRVVIDNRLTGYAAWLTVSQEQDAMDSLNVLRSMNPTASGMLADVLIIDSYALDITWEQVVRPYVDQIFVIDDLANRKHDCDKLLDQNFYLDSERRYDGLVPRDCELLLGPKYAILREEFYEARKVQRYRDGQIKKILVFYGGADLTGETSKAVRALIRLHQKQDFTADIIVGGSNSQGKEILELCSPHAYLRCHGPVNNMAGFMAEADLALGAGGTTTWERCYMGLPSIVTCIADNQLKGCQACANAGVMEYLGTSDEVTEDRIVDAIGQLSRDRLINYQIASEQLMGLYKKE